MSFGYKSISMKKYKIIVFIILISISSIHAQRMDSIEYQNGFLYFHEYDTRGEVPILILTGGPGNEYIQLEELAKNLSEDFWCILPEQRGAGRSMPDVLDSTTVNIRALTDDIKRLLVHLDLNHVNILGHSWGGMLAMNFAISYLSIAEKIILVGPGPITKVAEFNEITMANWENTYSHDELKRIKQFNKLQEDSAIESQVVEERRKMFRSAFVFTNPLPDSIFTKIDVKSNGITNDLLWTEVTNNFDLSKFVEDYKGQIFIITGRQDLLAYVSYE
jgi:pimeloyl-ACP methyl ester carboxylesterase